jgi:hypothetical protein
LSGYVGGSFVVRCRKWWGVVENSTFRDVEIGSAEPGEEQRTAISEPTPAVETAEAEDNSRKEKAENDHQIQEQETDDPRLSIFRSYGIVLGLFLQGLFSIVGPKTSPAFHAFCLGVLGGGMGIVDGVAPSVLGEVVKRNSQFRNTGKVFVLANMSVQLGFVVGPLLGNHLLTYIEELST